MKHTEYEWKAEDGLKLFAQSWTCDEEPRAALCLVHGLGEHSSRYTTLRDFLLSSNIALLTLDLRGHGKSEGKRGHIPSYDIILSDLQLLLRKTEELFPGRKIFIFGNSMGGNFVINFALRNKPNLSGVVLTAPWLKLSCPPGSLRTWFAEKNQ